MGRKRTALQKVSPAELAADTTQARVIDLAAEPINAMETMLGGRKAFIASLAINAAPEIRNLLIDLLDPDLDKFSIGYLATKAGISLSDLLRAYRNGVLVKAQIVAVNQLADELPAIVKDVLMRARPYEETCTGCEGTGQMRVRPTKKCPVPDPVEIPCTVCRDRKTLTRLPDLERQRLVLEMAEVIKPPKGGPTFLQQFNLGTPATAASGVTPGSLEQMQQAVTDLLFKRAPTIDIEASATVDDV